MAALFGNFIYPLIIMFNLPLAAVGGLLGLKMVNLLIGIQPLDILTMLGFVILIGRGGQQRDSDCPSVLKQCALQPYAPS